MKRHFVPGGYDVHGVPRATTCCTGECNQGRSCPITVDRVCHAVKPRQPVRQRPVIGAQLEPGQVIRIHPAIERVRPSWPKRVLRAFRAVIEHLLAPCWGP